MFKIRMDRLPYRTGDQPGWQYFCKHKQQPNGNYRGYKVACAECGRVPKSQKEHRLQCIHGYRLKERCYCCPHNRAALPAEGARPEGGAAGTGNVDMGGGEAGHGPDVEPAGEAEMEPAGEAEMEPAGEAEVEPAGEAEMSDPLLDEETLLALAEWNSNEEWSRSPALASTPNAGFSASPPRSGASSSASSSGSSRPRSSPRFRGEGIPPTSPMTRNTVNLLKLNQLYEGNL